MLLVVIFLEKFGEMSPIVAFFVVPVLTVIIAFRVAKILESIIPENVPRYENVLMRRWYGSRLDDFLMYIVGGPVNFALILGTAIVLGVFLLIYFTTGSFF